MNDVRIKQDECGVWCISVNGKFRERVPGRAENALNKVRAEIDDAEIRVWAPDLGPATTVAARRMCGGNWLRMRR